MAAPTRSAPFFPHQPSPFYPKQWSILFARKKRIAVSSPYALSSAFIRQYKLPPPPPYSLSLEFLLPSSTLLLTKDSILLFNIQRRNIFGNVVLSIDVQSLQGRCADLLEKEQNDKKWEFSHLRGKTP